MVKKKVLVKINELDDKQKIPSCIKIAERIHNMFSKMDRKKLMDYLSKNDVPGC